MVNNKIKKRFFIIPPLLDINEMYPSELQAASLNPNSQGAQATLFTENSWQVWPAISFHSFGDISFQIDTF